MLEEVLKEMKQCGGKLTDITLGKAHLLLGCVYSGIGGTFKLDRRFAQKQWLAAAALPGKTQVGFCRYCLINEALKATSSE